MTEGRSFLLSPWQDQADRVTVARALNCTVVMVMLIGMA